MIVAYEKILYNGSDKMIKFAICLNRLLFMKIINSLFILFFSLLPLSLAAQAGSSLVIDEDSFRQEDEGFIIDRIGVDRSNRPCFRMILHLDRMTPEDISMLDVRIRSGNVVLMKKTLAVEKDGLVIEMTARPDIRFYIKHPTLGESNTVTISPEADKVYLMDGWAEQKLTVALFCARPGAEVWLDGAYRGTIDKDNLLNIPDVVAGKHTLKVQFGSDMAEQEIDVSSTSVSFNVRLQSAVDYQQFVIFKVTPADALVEFNGETLYVSDGMAQKLVPFGTYDYVIASEDYHTVTGNVTVNDVNNKKVINVDLKPAYGWITIDGSSAEDATVYIDNKLVGKAPLRREKLSSGTHKVSIVKPMYKSYEASVEITDADMTELRPILTADFASISLKAEDGVEIWVNEQKKGVGVWTGDLASGAYIVECRKENHRKVSQTITVTPDMEVTEFILKSPEPICGGLSIVSSPGEADIYLDGAKVGSSPLYLPKTIIGNHILKISKSGCVDWTGKVTISEGQVAEVNATLQSGAPVTFTSNAPDAQLYVDGALMGSANGTYDLPFGSHNVICKASGKKDFSKTINVTAAGGDRRVECRFGAARETITVNGVSFDMILVEGGTFTMGATQEQGSDTESDEKPVHQVTLSDYYIGETEVTQALWKAVMGTNTSNFKGDRNPVENVSWDDCQEFIRKLNKLTRRTFRLPTEAEWEYAARGGNQSKRYKYSGSDNINDVAWYSDNSGSKTHAVKTKSPNELGLYDMSGNVYEWCSDWYGSYQSSTQTNPQGPSSGSYRVLRGGSWYDDAGSCRVSYRNYYSPATRGYDSGLRLVLVPPIVTHWFHPLY
ncbi:MAG: PEGA domain-containing protein [Bacteroidales bacterium]|nr:PEGA domain-containing protein [Bacteroidales bacterium]